MMTKLIARIVVFTTLLVIHFAVFSQDSLLFTPATLQKETLEIDLAKISLEARNVIFSLKSDMRNAISEGELEKLKRKTGKTVSLIDSIISIRKVNNLEMRNIRSIKNLINFWKQKLEQVQLADEMIAEINKDLDKNWLKYSKKLNSWNLARITAKQYQFDTAVLQRIDQVVYLLDTNLLLLGARSDIMLGLLNETGRLINTINDKIERYERILFEKQENIFTTGHPSIFSIDYTHSKNPGLRESLMLLHKDEFQNLGIYFRNHINRVLWHLILTIIIVIIFFFLRKSVITEGNDENVIYRKSLKVILSNPGNSALIIVLFVSTIIYPNKPLLLIDLFRFVISVPLAITLINMAHRRYWSTIIAFEVLIILQIMNANLPTHLAFARFLLLFTALLEIHILVSLIRKLKRAPDSHSALFNFVILLIYFNVGLAAGGLIANIIGKVILSQTLLSAVSGTALAAVLIFLAMLVGNGLFMIFIDSKYSDFIHVVRRRKQLMKKRITRTFRLMSGIMLVYYLLEAFGFEVIIIDNVRDFLTKERALGTLDFTWGNILLFFFMIWASIVVSKIIRIILEEEVFDRMGLSHGLPNTIALLIRYILVTAGVFAAASAAGLELTKLTIILGAFSVGIGFGLQNIFNNLVSGLILLLERPIKIGDTIEVGELVGVVKSIGIRASNVHTLDGAEIIVPNGNLISSEVINWTLTDKRRRIEVLVGIAYGSDPYKAHDIFIKIVSEHPDVVKDPAPNVLFNNFGDSSLDFRLLFWTDNFDEWIKIRSEVIFKIYDALKSNGITIPFPQHDFHLRSVDPGIEITKKD